MSRIFPKTGMFGLSDGEEIVTFYHDVLTQYRRVTDNTDGWTDTVAMHSVVRVKTKITTHLSFYASNQVCLEA